jgi:hypothetical protein
MARDRVGALAGEPDQAGEQAQRVGAAAIGDDTPVELLSQRFRPGSDDLAGTLHRLLREQQLAVLGKLVPCRNHHPSMRRPG